MAITKRALSVEVPGGEPQNERGRNIDAPARPFLVGLLLHFCQVS